VLKIFPFQLDRVERALVGQPHSHGPSANMDSSGNFSIGVIEKCLARFGLQAINVMRPDIKNDALQRPGSYEDGFIFNLSEHWFSVRRVSEKLHSKQVRWAKTTLETSELG
jgi:ataxin-3